MKRSKAAVPTAQWRFNPAPGWPTPPEGWLPEPGWEPDPAWPAAPADWQCYLPDDPPSAQVDQPAPVGGSQRREVKATPPPPELRHSAEEVEQHLQSARVVTQTVAATLKKDAGAIARLQKSISDAGEAKKLQAIGMVKRVVVYDTQLKLPGRLLTLTPMVQAAADHQGNKQVVQGWVRRSTNDRREMMLQVQWPGGHEIVYWERNDKKMTGALVQPREVHAMAAAINIAAAASPAAHAARRERVTVAQRALVEYLKAARADLEPAVATSEGWLALLAEVISERKAHAEYQGDKAFMKRRASEEKSAAKVHNELAKVTESARASLASLAQLADEVTTALKAAEAEPEAEQVADPKLLRGDFTEASAQATANTTDDDVALLEDLARLHGAGVLTDDEFAEKKAEILRRL